MQHLCIGLGPTCGLQLMRGWAAAAGQGCAGLDQPWCVACRVLPFAPCTPNAALPTSLPLCRTARSCRARRASRCHETSLTRSGARAGGLGALAVDMAWTAALANSGSRWSCCIGIAHSSPLVSSAFQGMCLHTAVSAHAPLPHAGGVPQTWMRRCGAGTPALRCSCPTSEPHCLGLGSCKGFWCALQGMGCCGCGSTTPAALACGRRLPGLCPGRRRSLSSNWLPLLGAQAPCIRELLQEQIHGQHPVRSLLCFTPHLPPVAPQC